MQLRNDNLNIIRRFAFVHYLCGTPLQLILMYVHIESEIILTHNKDYTNL